MIEFDVHTKGHRDRGGMWLRIAGTILLLSACSNVSDDGGSAPPGSETQDVSESMENAQAAQSAGNVATAVDEYDVVLAADPDNRIALFNLGLLLRAQGDLEGSIDAWTELVDANPQLVVARYQRAITFRASGDYEAAVADLRIVVEVEPSNKDALDQLGTLLIALGEVDEGQEFLSRVFETGTSVASE